MGSRFTIVETTLNRVEFRWKWLRFLQHTFTLLAIISLLFLGVQIAILRGWVTSKPSVLGFLAFVAAAGFITWAIIAIAVVAGTPDRKWLASALEKVDPRLLDRLNTLLFLEHRPTDARAESFS